MRATTAELLGLLQEAAPSRVFNVKSASTFAEHDGIQLSDRHWLFIDAHENPTMVTLMDEDRNAGGQIEFWMVRSQDVLPHVVQSALHGVKSPPIDKEKTLLS